MSRENDVDVIIERIENLKRRRRAFILAHNYQKPEVQDIADFVGDSLEMAKKALEADADVIIVAGVSFMAEVAAILNPDKVVLHPDPTARCPLADFLTPSMIREARSRYPNRPVVLYINTYVDSKVLADYIVTSSSAPKLISRLGHDEVIFGPDKNLADHVSELVSKKIIPLPPNGCCPVHEYLISEYYLLDAMSRYPNAKILVHPETPRSVRKRADFVGSTSQMLKAVGEMPYREFLLGTEEGLAYRARKLYPEKIVRPLNPKAICTNMKKITLLKILKSLEELRPKVNIDRRISERVREIMLTSMEMVR
ncbi:MAG: quinolinate synthase [Desulfurococcales archaeon ex4484_42]|nr:MAG: quinolinate synthase [Desulfurococcales archaeon ex4484_42]